MNVGAFGENFPYSNFHDLNMDWIIKITKDFLDQYTNIQSTITNGLDSLTQKATELEALLQAWYDTHSVEIAQQLARALADALATFKDEADQKAARTIASIPSDYTTLAGDVSIVQNVINNSLIKNVKSLVSISDLEQGSITTEGLSDATTDPAHNYRVRTIGYIPLNYGTRYILAMGSAPNMTISVSFYTTADYVTPRIGVTDWIHFRFTNNYIITPPKYCRYCRLIIRWEDDDLTHPITTADIAPFWLYLQSTNYGLNNHMYYTNAGIYAQSGQMAIDSTSTISTPPLNTGTVIVPEGKAVAFIVLYSSTKYMGKINAQGNIDSVAGNWKRFTGEININQLLQTYGASYVAMALQSTDENDPINPTTYQDWGNRNILFINEQTLLEYIESLIYADDINFVLGEDLHKTHIKTDLVGQISGVQAFCKYNGYWYSTNGSNLYQQDATFNLINTYPVNLGHGNSLQLGSIDGMAYASGWDDDKVYQINLNTHEIENIYILPVSGYTTCAVDDRNNIMYIFYRTSVPSTPDIYEFIVWNYQTSNIISRKYINEFAAMQACDYINGKIAVAYGLSNTDAGLFVYNTSGDMTGDYKLYTITGSEPEGVFVDRETRTMYFSLINGNVYKIK